MSEASLIQSEEMTTPGYVQESFSMLGEVRKRLARLVEEIDEVIDTAQGVMEEEFEVIEGGEDLKCENCQKTYKERRSPNSPCYGYCSPTCFREAEEE